MIDRCFTIKASPVDTRDHVFRAEPTDIANSVDLRTWDSLVESQGDLSSCSGNAMTNCYELLVKKTYPDRFVDLSRLYVYYYTRLIENSLGQDDGILFIRNMLRAVQKYGLCREELWPYDEQRIDDLPTEEARNEARYRTVTEYRSVRAQTDMLVALNQGYPLLVGMEIFEDFLDLAAPNPVVSMPDEKSRSAGGHAVAVLGYDLGREQFLIKNSFGTEWGDQGYAWMPFEYVRYYVFDRWCFDINDQTTQVVPAQP